MLASVISKDHQLKLMQCNFRTVTLHSHHTPSLLLSNEVRSTPWPDNIWDTSNQRCFFGGYNNFSTRDAPRPGQPKTVTTPEIIDQIHELILEDNRILTKSIAEQLVTWRE